MVKKSFRYGKKALLYLVGVFLAGGIFYACLPKDLEKVNFDLKPELFVPIAYGTFQLDDVIRVAYDDSALQYTDDSLMLITFRQDAIYKQSVKELLALPNDFEVDNITLDIGKLPYGDINYTENFPFGNMISILMDIPPQQVIVLEGSMLNIPFIEKDINQEFALSAQDFQGLESLDVVNGNLVITLTNDYPVAIGLDGVIYDEVLGDTIADISFEKVDAGASQTKTYSLAGRTITNNIKAKANYVKAYPSGGDVKFVSNKLVKMDISFQGLEFAVEGEELFEVGLEEGYNLTAMKTKNAQIGLNVTAGIPVDINLTVHMPDITKDGVEKTETFTIPAGDPTFNYQVDISNSVVDFTNGKEGTYNKLRLFYTLDVKTGQNVNADNAAEQLKVSIVMKNVEFEYIDGDIQEKEIVLESGVAEFPIDFWDSFSGSLSFTDPRIKFFADNSIGMTNEMNMQFTGYNIGGDSVKLNPPVISLKAPVYPNSNSIHTEQQIDKSNSNLDKFMNFPPNKAVKYNGLLTLNPKSNAQKLSRIDPDAELVFGYEVEMPMHFKSNGMSFSKAFAINGIDFAELQSAVLVLRYKNRIPLDIKMKLSFRDSTLAEGEQVLGTLDQVGIMAAPTDAEGKATGEKGDAEDIELNLDSDLLNSLKTANVIYIDGSFATPEDGTKDAKLYLSDYLDIKFLVRAKLDLLGGSNGN